MKRRLLATLMAVLMVAGLVLNVSAASYYREFDRSGYTLYAIASNDGYSVRVETACDSSTVTVHTKLITYTTGEEGKVYVLSRRETKPGESPVINYSSWQRVVYADTVHYADGISFYETRVYPD